MFLSFGKSIVFQFKEYLNSFLIQYLQYFLPDKILSSMISFNSIKIINKKFYAHFQNYLRLVIN
jgi:hypothetical protein